MYMFNEMASFINSFEIQCDTPTRMAYDRKDLAAENFDLDQFLTDHAGEYTVFINGSCNLKTGDGAYKCVSVYNRFNRKMGRDLPNQTSAVSSIVSGLLEMFPHLTVKGKKVNLVFAQELSLMPCGSTQLDHLKTAFCDLCKEKGFTLTLYKLRGETAANTIRQIVGMPVKSTKKFSPVKYSGNLSCFQSLI